MSRGGFKIERADIEYERSEPCSNWLSNFANEYAANEKKTAVEVMRERNEPSIFDRMNAIMGGGGRSSSPYGTVDEAVADYQKRTGLLDYQKLAVAQAIIDAGEESEEKKTFKPQILIDYPAIDSYIRNVIDTQHGIQLPAIVHGIREIFGRDGVRETDLDSPELYRYISKMMRPSSRQYDPGDSVLGRGIGRETEIYELNDQNRDPFVGLMPRRMT